MFAAGDAIADYCICTTVFVSSRESCIYWYTTLTQTPSQLKIKGVITLRAPQQGAPHPL